MCNTSKIEGTVEIEKALTSGEADIGMNYAAPIIIRVDAGVPVVVLAGGHVMRGGVGDGVRL